MSALPRSPSDAAPAVGDAEMVRADGLVRRYGTLTAVDGISFAVRRGEMFGLIGPDGAGKTTTLRMVLGLLDPHGGHATTCGLDPVKQHRRLSRKVGYLSQRFSLYGDLSVDENIAFFASVHGVRDWKPRRDQLLELLRMAPFRERLADRLSGGMKQKLALAATLIHTPELLVLDEPTTGVDPVSRRDFWKILARLQRDGLTILLTTPYLDEAERCQRVALVDRGRVLLMDAPDALRANAGLALVEVLAEPRAAAERVVRADAAVTGVQVFGERLHATLATTSTTTPPVGAGLAPPAIVERLRAALVAAGCTVQELRPVPASLEDVFIANVRPAGPDAASSAGAGSVGAGLASEASVTRPPRPGEKP